MKPGEKLKLRDLLRLATVGALLWVNITNQECASEVTNNGIPVLWPTSPDGTWTVSEPQCFGSDGDQVSRLCNGSNWNPTSENIPPCMTVTQQFDPDCCPPGYFRISNISTNYCFQIGEPAAWDYPCFSSGGASVITDLNDTELNSLLTALKFKKFDQYWLPGRRQKHFNPATWAIPGPNWGEIVVGSQSLALQESIFSNCLYLEVGARRLRTGSCDQLYPSLCLFLNKVNIPAKCPSGYHAFRFMPEKESCFGIEHSSAILGNTFDDFVTNQCPNPMISSSVTGNLERFIFFKLAELTGLSDSQWCWYRSSFYFNGTHVTKEEESQPYVATEIMIASLQGMLNSQGTMGLMNVQSRLPCMACEKNVTHENTHLSFEYNDVDHKMYLTVYYPSGLWKDRVSDKGMQCFSNDKGFVRVVEIEDAPYFEVNYGEIKSLVNDKATEDFIAKVVYKIKPVNDRSAQYWCEGHSKNLTFLETNKIVVNPRGEEEHVFALVVNISSEFYHEDDNFYNMHELLLNISNVLDAKQVLVMDILDVNNEYITILVHVHVYLDNSHEEDLGFSYLVVDAYNTLIRKAVNGFPDYNIKFVNMSSSTRCLPSTTTNDIFVLNWEITPVGQITAPKQFCLQENGLPVTRRCGGSYLMGACWREVDGTCNKNYAASNTTTFLYNVAKGQVSRNSTANFLTQGLGTVLYDLDIIIPADIYYLSMSFQYILTIAGLNESYVDVGDINNIAWIMNQVMVLDWDYLRLAQTLNSTNVIVDSINNIIEMIAITHTNSFNENDVKKKIDIAVEPKFIVQITYPAYNNVTGLALIKETHSNNFTDMKIKSLFSGTKLCDVLLIENLEVAAWVPEEVLNTLQENKNYSESETATFASSPDNVHIVISIFSNDAVFQEIDYTPHNINGRIIGITIPGFISNLQFPVTIVFKEFDGVNASKSCGYWDFNVNAHGSAPGFWASNGCILADYFQNYTVCQCYHLTHFGQLISKERRSEDDEINAVHDRMLNVITLVGCFLSLLGIAGIWMTAIVFHSWRQKPGSKVLLQLSGAIAIPLLLILLFNLDLGLFEVHEDYYQIRESKKGACIFLGATLHFSILAGFTWMLITAVLQFIRYVRVLGVHRPTRFMCKLAVVGWGVPLVPVIITLLVDRNNYIPAATPADSVSVVPICYPTGMFFYFGVILPIGSVLIINVVLFMSVLYSISRGPDGKFRSADTDLICAQLRLSVFLFFLLGLTWTFGIFSFGDNGMILSYLFCLTSTLQGFVLFVYFVVCDPATRLLWVSLMKPQFRMSVTSLTTTN